MLKQFTQLRSSFHEAQAKHTQIHAYLEKSIRSGLFQEGVRIPPETQIAKELGVSRGTVRQAIERLVEEGLCMRRRGDGTFVSFSPQTVIAPAKRGNQTVLILVQNARSHTILHPFFEETVRGVAESLGSRGKVQFSMVEEDHNDSVVDKEIEAADSLVLFGDHREGLLQRIQEYQKPAVSIQFRYRRFPFSSVTVDNRAAGYLAGQHLIEAGCRHIYYFASQIFESEFMDRANGVREALREASMDLPPENIISLGTRESGMATEKLKELASKKPIDGLIGCRDILALELLHAAKGLQEKRKPIRVIGFDDIYASVISSPALTTVRQPTFQMGKIAVKILHEVKSKVPQHKELQPVLVIRESTREGV